MKVERIKIEGYGRFRGLELSLSPGLNLIYGPNEAGKSTVMSFIRAVLFGFEKKASPARYDTEGAPYGGEMLLQLADGPLWVRRVRGRRFEGELSVRRGTGEALDNAELQAALAGIDRSLYFELFAFGLDGLRSFVALAEEGSVSQALSSIAIPGARRLPEALKALDKSTDELYSPKSNRKKLNEAMSALKQARDDIQKLGDPPEEYFEVEKQLDALKPLLFEAERRERACQSALLHLQRMEKAFPLISELRKLQAHPVAPREPAVSEADVARAQQLSAHLGQLAQHLGQHQAELGAIDEELERAAAAACPADLLARAQSLVEEHAQRAPFLEEYPQRLAQLARRREALRDRREKLFGRPVGEEEFGSLLLRAPSVELRAIREALASSKLEVQQAESSLRQCNEWVAREQAARDEASAKLEELEAGGSASQVSEESEGDDASGAPSVEFLEGRYGALLQLGPLQADCAAKEQAALRAEHLSTRMRRRAYGMAWGRASSLVAALLLPAVVLFAGETSTWAVASAAIAFCAGALGGWRLAPWVALARRDAERALAGAERAGRERDDAFALRELTARRAGVPISVSPAEMAELQEQWRQQLGRQRERAQLLGQLIHAEERGKQAQAAFQRAQDALRTSRESLSRREGALREWLLTKGLPSGLSADEAHVAWTEMGQLHEASMRLREDEEQLAAAHLPCAELARRLSALARELGFPEERATEALRRLLSQEGARAEEERALRARRGVVEGNLKRAHTAKEGAAEQLAAALARAKAVDLAELATLAQDSARFTAYEAACRHLALQLAPLHEGTLEDLLAEAAQWHSVEEISSLRSQAEGQLSAAKKECAELAHRKGELEGRRQHLAQDRQLAEARFREEALATSVLRLAEDYAQEKLAAALLERARKKFEGPKQPKLLQRASCHFERITSGRYLRVHTVEGGRGLAVVDAADRPWDAELLSRGTREQLYLAFRLALLEEFGESKAALPVLLDDVWVNFDSPRAEASIDAFRELSRKHQVIAFSCHGWVRDAFRNAGAHVISLSSSTAELPHKRAG
jgi:uncharacterized protein YhaN